MAQSTDPGSLDVGNNQLEPGTVIAPNSAPASSVPAPQPQAQPASTIPTAPAPQSTAPQAAAPVPVPSPSPTPAAEPASQPEAEAPELASAGFYTDTNADTDTSDQTVTWTASEFVAHDKSATWYLLLAVGIAVLAAGIFFLTKDYVSLGVVVIAGLLLGSFAHHQPRQLQYSLDNQGLSIGSKHYSYSEFKSFAVMDEGAISGIVFTPLKRFATFVTVYYAPEDEDKILAILSAQLPLEEHKLDAVDALMRRIRF
jgi:hypothetical protein